MIPVDRVTPWLERNCRRCDHAGRCELEKALYSALRHWAPLPASVADRMGVPHNGLFGPWTCSEFTLSRRPPTQPARTDDPADSPRPEDSTALPPSNATASIE